MKRIFFLFAFLFFASQLKAQVNLVPNPSFEEYDTCPDLLDRVQYATHWMNFGNSPDYYNSCSVLTDILTGFRIIFLVIGKISFGKVALNRAI